MRNAAAGSHRVTWTTLLTAIAVVILAPHLLAQGARLAPSRPPATVLAGAEPCDGPAAVCALLQRFLVSFNARDFEAFRQTFADDISFFVDRPYPPRRLDGRAAAEAVFAGGFAPYAARTTEPKPPLPTPLVPAHLRVQAFGDVAVITFEVVRPMELARRTLVAHHEGSEWRIVHIHGSSADTAP